MRATLECHVPFVQWDSDPDEIEWEFQSIKTIIEEILEKRQGILKLEGYGHHGGGIEEITATFDFIPAKPCLVSTFNEEINFLMEEVPLWQAPNDQ